MPLVSLPAHAASAARDPLIALTAEYKAIEYELNDPSILIEDDDCRFMRLNEIEREIVAGAAPTTTAGVLAALDMARRELAPTSKTGAVVSPQELMEFDAGEALVLALIDAVAVTLASAVEIRR